MKTSLILAEIKKAHPDDDDESHISRTSSEYFTELEDHCNDIWESPKVGATVWEVLNTKGKAKLIVAIIKCTHPDDRLLPPADKIEEMRKIFVARGFTGEFGWFKPS